MATVNKLHIYTDGCSRGNPGSAAIAFIIYDDKGNLLHEHKQGIGEATNNTAEYKAIIRALEIATGYSRRKIVVYSDSEVVIRQITRKYKIKKPHLLELFNILKDKERAFESVAYRHKNRTHPRIQRADKLANDALDKKSF